MATNDCFTFVTALGSFHVYHGTVNWNPYIGQDLSFKCELNNMHKKFAVCSKALLPGKIVPVDVGHVAKELSRHIWFAIQKGTKVSAVVDNTKSKPSPLLQGGLEILIKVAVHWNNKNYIKILKEKVSKINFQHYEDASKEIRENVKAIEAEETDSGDKMNDDNDGVVLLYIFIIILL